MWALLNVISKLIFQEGWFLCDYSVQQVFVILIAKQNLSFWKEDDFLTWQSLWTFQPLRTNRLPVCHNVFLYFRKSEKSNIGALSSNGIFDFGLRCYATQLWIFLFNLTRTPVLVLEGLRDWILAKIRIRDTLIQYGNIINYTQRTYMLVFCTLI